MKSPSPLDGGRLESRKNGSSFAAGTPFATTVAGKWVRQAPLGREPKLYGAALDRESIRELIERPDGCQPPLVAGWQSLEEQLQPNGIDLTLHSLARFTSEGSVGRLAEDRQLPATEPLAFDPSGRAELVPGPYLVTFTEVVNLPLDLMALGLPRSSLLRSGVALYTAVWDAGYRGRSQALLTVHNPAGYRLQQGARLLQLVFFNLAQSAAQGYTGRYQGEGS